MEPDDLASCVECGLCLPHCPTYRVTGLEARSPRGRIRLLREVVDGAAVDASFVEAFDTCVGCLGCESACPSAVPYRKLLGGARNLIDDVEYRAYKCGRRKLRRHLLLIAKNLSVRHNYFSDSLKS